MADNTAIESSNLRRRYRYRHVAYEVPQSQWIGQRPSTSTSRRGCFTCMILTLATILVTGLWAYQTHATALRGNHANKTEDQVPVQMRNETATATATVTVTVPPTPVIMNKSVETPPVVPCAACSKLLNDCATEMIKAFSSANTKIICGALGKESRISEALADQTVWPGAVGVGPSVGDDFASDRHLLSQLGSVLLKYATLMNMGCVSAVQLGVNVSLVAVPPDLILSNPTYKPATMKADHLENMASNDAQLIGSRHLEYIEMGTYKETADICPDTHQASVVRKRYNVVRVSYVSLQKDMEMTKIMWGDTVQEIQYCIDLITFGANTPCVRPKVNDVV